MLLRIHRQIVVRTLLLALLPLVSLVYTPSVSALSTPFVENQIFNIAISPNGKLMAMATSFGIQVYRLSDGYIVYSLRDELQNYWEGTYANIAWSPDGSNLAIGKPNEGVRIWDVSSWKILADKTANRAGIDHPGFSWSPDGTQLALGMGGPTGEILIWNKIKNAWTTKNAYNGPQVSLVWASDGQLLVMAEQALYDANTGKFVKDISTDIDGAYRYAIWSPDTKLVFVFFDLGGDIINSQTNQHIGFGADGYPEIAWSMDGKYFAATSENDNEISVWDTVANKVIIKERQGDIIYAFAWLPNHELLAAGSENGHDILWNTTTGRVLFSLDEEFWLRVRGELTPTSRIHRKDKSGL